MKGVLALLAAGLAAGSQATVLFSDNFDTENGGNTQLNYASFANWSVTVGTVDLIANGAFGLSGSGMFVDLDGSANNAGRLTTIQTFNLTAGTPYILSFRLSGNQRGGANDTVDVSLGGAFSESFTRAPSAPWQLVTRNFTPGSNSSAQLVFDHRGSDNLGILLDDVSLEVVPEPASMVALGLGALALIRRPRA